MRLTLSDRSQLSSREAVSRVTTGHRQRLPIGVLEIWHCICTVMHHRVRSHNYGDHRDNSGRTKRKHNLFDHQPGLPSVRRNYGGFRVRRQVRKKLALRMGVGN
jgi:hypothetical protein